LRYRVFQPVFFLRLLHPTRCETDDGQDLEQLCRYITRLTIANKGLNINKTGQVILKLKTPYRNGTTHIVMSPMEFMQRLDRRTRNMLLSSY
jgi:hypothetical protein